MAPVDVSYFAERARNHLLRLLDNVPGKKNLVLQRAIVGPIELLVKFSALQEHGVDRVFFLENDNVDTSQRNVIFIAYGEKAQTVQAVAAQIKRLQQASQVDHDFNTIWAPRRTLVCNKLLEDAGILGDVTSVEWPLYLQPLEFDLMSMELEGSFGELYLRKDPSSLFLSAKALMQLQRRFGLFPRIMGKGANAKRLSEILVRLRSAHNSIQEGPKGRLTPSATIDNLIIVDRDTDFATPLLTQLTYEGLIDEIYGVRHGQAEVGQAIVAGTAQQAGLGGGNKDALPGQPAQSLKRKIKLDSSDKLYEQLRDANFAIVGGLLNKVARRLQTDYEGRHGNKTTSELKEFVNRLPGFQQEQQSLKIHTSLAEDITKRTRSEIFSSVLEIQQNIAAGTDPSSLYEQIEDLIARDCDFSTVLRLLCLSCMASGGMRAKDYDNFRRLVVQAYGYNHILTLDALEKMQLFYARGSGTLYIPGTSSAPAESRTNYSAVRRPLHLIKDEVSEQDPDDIAYVFSGYAPLSIRIVQCVLQKPYLATLSRGAARIPANGSAGSGGDASQGWKGFEDVLGSVKGPTFDEVQPSGDEATRARQALSGRGDKKTTVIFFVGGVTFAEIAALRFVARQERERRNVLICTTSIISGDKMMQAAIDAGTPRAFDQ